MELNSVEPNLRVKTTQLGSTKGFLIKEKHLTVRRVGVTGTVLNHVPGHGGDVWFVRHDDSDEVGAYAYDEFEPIRKKK